jgi:arsenite/tail-anchored protein-transporting ATPase
VAELTFFIGKGGVGKTSVSAAYAVHNALAHPAVAVLLLSTDPAHSLGDVLQVPLTGRVTAVRLPRGKLYAWQVNAEKQFRRFLGKYEEALLETIERGSIFSRQDIKPLLDTALPGMAEMAGLLAIEQAVRSRRYGHIVVDTAPFGHTLRLFALPEQFERLLRFFELAGSRDQLLAQHFGGSARVPAPQFLEEWRGLLQRISDTLAGAAQLYLVSTPERFALNESLRCVEALEARSPALKISAVVLNRAVARGTCPPCRGRASQARRARTLLERRFPRLYLGEDSGSPIAGVKDLASFGAHVFAAKPLKISSKPGRAAVPKLVRAHWPSLEPTLSLVVGKGGVGKTTIASALAFRARRRGEGPVTICSVDPAPSLDDIFRQPVGDIPAPVLGDAGLRACEMDSAAGFADWVQRLRVRIEAALSSEHAGLHLDISFERRLFSALFDIVPPGVDEVFAVFRIMDLLAGGSKRVVIDMAPTGHALELLRMPDRMAHWARLLLKTLAAHRTLALARDVAVDVAEFGQRARELALWLADKKRASLWTVMLPEALPDRETERLLRELRALQLPIAGLFVNRVLFPQNAAPCPRCRRARLWQLSTLQKLRGQEAGVKIFLVRNFPAEIAGKSGLLSFTSELWQFA